MNPLIIAIILHGKLYPKKNSKSLLAIKGVEIKKNKYPISGKLIMPNQTEAQGIY
jgi:hypothetical protein